MVSPDGKAPSRMVGVSASVDLPLNHKVQRFSSGTSLPGWSRIKGHKTVVMVIFHGSVTTCLTFGGIFYYCFGANLLLSILRGKI